MTRNSFKTKIETKIYSFLSLILSFLGFMNVSCYSSAYGSPQTEYRGVKINGLVLDEEDKPVENINVTVKEIYLKEESPYNIATTVTDRDGKYDIYAIHDIYYRNANRQYRIIASDPENRYENDTVDVDYSVEKMKAFGGSKGWVKDECASAELRLKRLDSGNNTNL